MNGPMVATKIRNMLDEAEVKQPYICCCTAYTDESFMREAFASGMDSFQTKPVSAVMIEKFIQSYIS